MAIFAPTVLLRSAAVREPLGEGHAWLSATVLRTHEIWAGDGIGTWRYLPIMTYGSPADRNIDNQASLPDTAGRWYYTSYGPLSYVVPYGLSIATGSGPSAALLAYFNMSLQLVTAMLIAMIVVTVTRPANRRECLPAIAAFAAYVFTPETLWFHGKPYMADMFVQPLFALALLIVVRTWDNLSFRHALALFLTLFAAVLSEWIGVFVAVAICVVAILGGMKPRVRVTVCCALAVVSAVVLIVAHYSMIAGFDALLDAALAKFRVRSGTADASAYGMFSARGWAVISSTYWRGYWPLIAVLALAAAMMRWRSAAFPDAGMWKRVLLLAAIPVVLHHLLFFEFTAEHSFSALKSGILLALLAGFVVHLALHSSHAGLSRVTMAAVVLLLVPVAAIVRDGSTRSAIFQVGVIAAMAAMGIWSSFARGRGSSATAAIVAVLSLIGAVGGYQSMAAAARNDKYFEDGTLIARSARPDQVVFITDSSRSAYPALPMTVLYARRNLAEWRGVESARALIRRNGATEGILFRFGGGTPTISTIR